MLILSAREGHASLAAAAAAALEREPGAQVAIEDWIGDSWFFGGYRFLYRFAPKLFSWPYRLGQLPAARPVIGEYFWKQHRRSWQQRLARFHPDAVLATYWAYLPVLDRFAGQAAWKYFNIVPDPITGSPLTYSSRAINLGFGKEFRRHGQQLGISPSQLKIIGWLTQPEFFRRYRAAAIRRRLGLRPRRRTLLFCTGSEGNQAILPLLPQLFFQKFDRPFQLIIVAGSNRGLRRTISQSYRLAKKVARPPLLYLTGFSREMAKLIAASDVVFGKAGPNLIFESVAQQKPFVAISHIHGQETGNLELIRSYQLGWVAEKLRHRRALLKAIINDPLLLASRQKQLAKMARRNKMAAARLRQAVFPPADRQSHSPIH